MKFRIDVLSRNAALCVVILALPSKNPNFLYTGLCSRFFVKDVSGRIPTQPCPCLLWEKSTSAACASWKFWYTIFCLSDALRSYGKLFDETNVTRRTPEHTFLRDDSMRSADLTVQPVFPSSGAGAVSEASACGSSRGRSPARTETAAAQDQPVTPHDPLRPLLPVPPPWLHHMTWLSHRTLWENRDHVCSIWRKVKFHAGDAACLK